MKVEASFFFAYHLVGVLLTAIGMSAQYAHVPIVPFIAYTVMLIHASRDVRLK